MTPLRRAERLALGETVLLIWLVWWSPTIALNVARHAAVRGRFLVEMATVDVLYALRRDRAARGILARLICQERRGIRAARRRVRIRR